MVLIFCEMPQKTLSLSCKSALNPSSCWVSLTKTPSTRFAPPLSTLLPLPTTTTSLSLPPSTSSMISSSVAMTSPMTNALAACRVQSPNSTTSASPPATMHYSSTIIFPSMTMPPSLGSRTWRRHHYIFTSFSFFLIIFLAHDGAVVDCCDNNATIGSPSTLAILSSPFHFLDSSAARRPMW